MQEQNAINEQIAKEEQRNVYLAELLKSLEEKLAKAKNGGDKQVISENRAELEIAQIKSLDKKIELYRQELQKLKQLNTANVVAELKVLRGQIESKEQTLQELDAEYCSLHEEVNGLRARNAGKEKNKEMEKLFGEREYEMKILEKKLKELQNIEGNKNFRPPKKSARSFSQIVKEKDLPEGDKKGKIDKYAMYRNLVKFYGIEEEKLRKETEQLGKEREESRVKKEKYYQIQKEMAQSSAQND